MPLTIDLAASQGAAVLGLLERSKVPPLPAFYRLLYDYVADVHTPSSARVGEIVATGHEVSERLYSEFVAPYENHASLEQAVARITARLTALNLLIEERVGASRAHSASLNGVGRDLTGAHLDVALIHELIGRVNGANERIAQSNAALMAEIDAANFELDATRSELDRLRSGGLLDAVTGLSNRPGLDQALERAVAQGQEADQSLSCVALDIDHFKSLNDNYGHPVGDEILRIVGRAMLVSTRQEDANARIGGDEFVAVLPGTDLATARQTAERIRQAIIDSDLRGIFGKGVLGGVTASLGVATLRRDDSVLSLMARADACLYEAKRLGRNRVFCEGDPGMAPDE